MIRVQGRPLFFGSGPLCGTYVAYTWGAQGFLCSFGPEHVLYTSTWTLWGGHLSNAERSADGPFPFQPACRHFVPHRRGWTRGCAFGVVGPHQFARFFGPSGVQRPTPSRPDASVFGSSPQQGDPNIKPQHTTVLSIGTLKGGSPDFGKAPLECLDKA